MEKSEKRNSIVVVGDLVASRKIAARSTVQNVLEICLKNLNRVQGEGLLSPYTITLGDEFQAVFSRPERLLGDALKIFVAVHPVLVRISFGIGEITTPINPEQAIGMDGPAFHAAREGIERLKQSKNLLVIAGPSVDRVGLANQSLALVAHLMRKWHRNRLEVLLGLYERRTVKEIAEGLGVTDKAVYKVIENGAMRTMIQLFGEITGVFTPMMEQE
jgi:hypothetical protein